MTPRTRTLRHESEHGCSELVLGHERSVSRDDIVRDPEGNLWSFGTYRPGVLSEHLGLVRAG